MNEWCKKNKVKQSGFDVEQVFENFVFLSGFTTDKLSIDFATLANHILFAIDFIHEFSVNIFCDFKNLSDLIELN